MHQDEKVLLQEALSEYGISHHLQDIIIEHLDNLFRFHEETWRHSIRVGILAGKIGRYCGLNAKALFWAGIFHDIGKMLIGNRALLEKNTGFTAEDYERIKSHVDLGFGFLIAIRLEFSAHIMKHHHRFGKNPYPAYLPELPERWKSREKEFEIHGRILALADCYDALMHRNNDRNGNVPLTAAEHRDLYIRENQDLETLIHALIDDGILAF